MPIALFHSRKPSGLGGNPARGEAQSEKEQALAFLEWIQKKVLIWEKLQWVRRCPLEQIIDIGGAMEDKLFYAYLKHQENSMRNTWSNLLKLHWNV